MARIFWLLLSVLLFSVGVGSLVWLIITQYQEIKHLRLSLSNERLYKELYKSKYYKLCPVREKEIDDLDADMRSALSSLKMTLRRARKDRKKAVLLVEAKELRHNEIVYELADLFALLLKG